MKKLFTTVLPGALLLASLASIMLQTSCGGTLSGMDPAAPAGAGSGSTGEASSSVASAGGNPGPSAPLITIAPPRHKELFEWLGQEDEEQLEFKWEIDPGFEFFPDHILVDDSLVTFKTWKYLATSGNTDVVPAPLPILWQTVLSSGPNEVSFVTYGLKGIPQGEELQGIRVYLDAECLDNDEAPYIGIIDAEKGSYHWLGRVEPEFLQENEEISVAIAEVMVSPLIDTTDDFQHAYITIAAYGGETLGLYAVHASVGQPGGSAWQMPETEILVKRELVLP